MPASIGIDISGDQPDDVPGDFVFIVVKSTEGNRVVNPRVHAQWANAARTTRGLYHYARPAISDGASQATIFAADALGRGFRPGIDMFQLDAEDGENAGVGNWAQFIDAFMGVALARLGPRGFLYAGWPFVQAHGLQDHIVRYKWWLPDYGPNTAPIDNGLAHLAGIADHVVIHQYSSAGGLDLNTIVNRAEFAGTAPKPVPPVWKVKPMYDPAFNIPNVRGWCPGIGGKGAYLVTDDGALYCFGTEAVRGMNGNPNFAGRHAAGVHLRTAGEPAGTVTIVAGSGEKYTI